MEHALVGGSLLTSLCKVLNLLDRATTQQLVVETFSSVTLQLCRCAAQSAERQPASLSLLLIKALSCRIAELNCKIAEKIIRIDVL